MFNNLSVPNMPPISTAVPYQNPFQPLLNRYWEYLQSGGNRIGVSLNSEALLSPAETECIHLWLLLGSECHLKWLPVFLKKGKWFLSSLRDIWKLLQELSSPLEGYLQTQDPQLLRPPILPRVHTWEICGLFNHMFCNSVWYICTAVIIWKKCLCRNSQASENSITSDWPLRGKSVPLNLCNLCLLRLEEFYNFFVHQQ